MNVAIEATGLMGEHRAGIASYTRHLAIHLSGRRDINLTLFYKLSRYRQRRFRFLPHDVPCRWYHSRTAFGGGPIDIAHSCDSHFLNLRRSCRVVTVHDLAVLKPEFQFPHYSSPQFAEASLGKLQAFMRSADTIITVSKSTKDDILERFDFPEQNIHVVYLGHDDVPEMVPPAIRTGGKPYFLFVGTISVRKNLVNLIRAYRQSGLGGHFDLVLAGASGMGSDIVMTAIREQGVSDTVRTPGYVPDEQLPALYANAAALLFPTFYEGFGLPIIQAMSHGIPVLAGDRGAAPEVAGGFAVTVDPFSVEAIADGIRRVTGVQPGVLDAARTHARAFTWGRMADETIDVYRKTLRDGNPEISSTFHAG